eukprot:IDg10891t1
MTRCFASPRNCDSFHSIAQYSFTVSTVLGCGIDEIKPKTGDTRSVIKSVLQLRPELSFLRTIYRSSKDTDDGAMYIFEALSTSSVLENPTGLRWIHAKDVDVESVEQYLDNFTSHGFRRDESKLRFFENVGWYYSVRDWIQSRLKEYRVSSILQKHVSDVATVLEVSTSCGEKFFFKGSSSKWLTDEAAATHALGEVMSSHFEAVVGVDLVRNWVLMRNYGEDMTSYLRDMLDCGSSQEKEQNLAVMHDVLRQWGEIQMRSVRNTAQLVKAGIPKLSPEKRKRKLLALIAELWKKIEDYGVPFALVHEDLLPDNVCQKNARGRYSFYDFGCIKISYPFLDAITIFSVHSESLDSVSSEYLMQWAPHESEDRLRALLELVYKLDYCFCAINMFFYYVNGDSETKALLLRDLEPLRPWSSLRSTLDGWQNVKHDIELLTLTMTSLPTRIGSSSIHIIWVTLTALLEMMYPWKRYAMRIQ